MKNFLVIDGNSIMNRAFYGVMNSKMLSTKEGIYTNAIYGFLNIYWMILEKVNFDYVAVSFDLNKPTFRHKMYDGYKANRKAMPEELKMQMPLIKDVLNAMNIPIFEMEGYEADDILGTVSKINEKNNIFTYILTGDRDSFQLISSLTSVIIPSNKFSKTEYNIYTPELLKQNYSIDPYQVIEVKALMGDSSDNIPGVKGIGEKTAYLLINKYANIDAIYNNIENIEVTQKIKEKLLNDKEMAYKSKTLATINREVPIDLDYEKCKLTDSDRPKLYELFKKLEFHKFISKFNFDDLPNNENTVGSNDLDINKYINLIRKEANYIYINDNNIYKLLDFLDDKNNENKKISYYLYSKDFKEEKNNENNFLNTDDDILAIYDDSLNNIYVCCLDLHNPKTVEILNKFALSNLEKLGYYEKKDMLYIFDNISDNVSKFTYDIMIAYYLMDSNRSNYNISYILDDLFSIKFEANLDSNEQISMFTEENTAKKSNNILNKDKEKLLTTYLKAIFYSYDIIMDKLKSMNMVELFENIEMPLAETLAYIEHTGMYIDINNLNKFNEEITININLLENEIYNIAGEKFNINSTQQLGNILFNKLGLPTSRKNKTGFSTDKEVLDDLSDKHPIIDKILDYRQLVKLKTTYVDGLKGKIASDGRIHTTFMQTVASTGRLSSVEPNLQNIPVKLELGKKIRSFFVGEKSNVIVDADYSQIELRVLADLSNDQTMIDAFNNNIDIHKVTASQVFNTKLEDVTHEMRSKAKAVNFGIVYGISEFGLAKNINCTRAEAKEYITNYLKKYNGIKTFMDNTVVEASKVGYVTTIFNRRRYIPQLSQKNKNIIQFGQRIAMNTPIQGSAADIIKLAMNKIYKELKLQNLKSKLIMQVHDELIIEAIPEEVDQVKDIMNKYMENIIKLKVPLNIDLNVGKSWYDTK